MTKFNPGRDLDLDPTTSRHMPGSYSIQGASTLRVTGNSDNGKVFKNHAQTDGQPQLYICEVADKNRGLTNLIFSVSIGLLVIKTYIREEKPFICIQQQREANLTTQNIILKIRHFKYTRSKLKIEDY